MEFTNTLTLTMKSTEVAENVLGFMKETITNMSNKYNEGYDFDALKKFSQSIVVNDNVIEMVDEVGCFMPEDISEVLEDVLVSIAKMFSLEEFSCSSYTDSTYGEINIDVAYSNGEMELKSEYYSMGYMEETFCSECDCLISLVDIENAKEYICPECGEVIDLSEYLPKVEEKKITIC